MPKVYVTTDKKYLEDNNPKYWIDLKEHTKESFYKLCAELHSDEEEPHCFVVDTEDVPFEFHHAGCNIVTDNIWEWLELNDEDKVLLAKYMEAKGDDDQCIEEAEYNFCGTAPSNIAFIQNFFEKQGPIGTNVDWEKVWSVMREFFYTTERGNKGTIWYFKG